MKFSSLVFDLDGTLSDPSLGIVRCFNHAFEQHGLPQVDEALIRQQIGPPLDQGFRRFVPEATPAFIDVLVATYRERYGEVGYAENEVYEGIPQALQVLSDAAVPMGVCTSKRGDFARMILERFDLLHHFNFVDGGDTGIAKSAQLAGLIDRNSIDLDAVMIGDRAVDIESARDNGLHGVAVPWGFAEPDELVQARPFRILENVNDLMLLIHRADQ